MSEPNQYIIIYASENGQVAQSMQTTLQEAGKEAMLLEKSTADYSEQLGQIQIPAGARVVFLLTDNFLKSYGCMNGILQAAHKWGDDGRLIPVVTDGVEENEEGTVSSVSTDFERVNDIIQYMNFWQDKYLFLRKEKRARPDDHELDDLIAATKEISADVGEFLRYIRGVGYSYLEGFLSGHSAPDDQSNSTEQPDGLGIIESYAPENQEDTPQPDERSLVEMIENSSEELMAENPGIHQSPEEMEDQVTDDMLSNIPGLDLLNEPPADPETEPSITEKDQDATDQEETPSDSGPAPGEEEETAIPPNFSEREIEKLDEENDELMSILDEVLAEEEMPELENTEFRFVGDDPDNPEEFDIDAFFDEEEKNNLTNMSNDHDDDDTPVGENEVLLNLVEGDDMPLAEEILEEAIDLFRENQTEEGMAHLALSVKNQPTNTTIRYYHAYALARYANDFEGAKSELEILLKQDRTHPEAWFLLAELAENQQDFEGARKCFEKVIEHEPGYPEAEYRLGILLADHFPGEEAIAAQHLKKAIVQNEQNVDAYYMLAALLNEHLDQPENSVKHFRKVLSLQPKHPFANYDLALVYHGLGDQTRAIEFYQKAIAVNPELKTEQNDIAFGIGEKEAVASESAIYQKNQSASGDDPTETNGQEHFAPTAGNGDRVNEPNEIPNGQGSSNEERMENEKDREQQAATSQFPSSPTAVKTTVVLVTGATAGIGKATAEVFAKNGYRVIMTGRRQERLADLAKSLTSQYECAVETLAFDVRDQNAVQMAFNDLPDDWKNVDILINNAGLSRGLDPIHNGNTEDWETMIDTNIKGLLYVTRAISPHMVGRKKGHIINVSSIAGTEVYPGGNVYSATKAAVSSLTRSMRIDLHQHNIRVSQVSPGHVEETEFARVRFDGDTERAEKVYENFQPLKSVDVAETIYFIATRPAHVNIQDVYMFGTQQANATTINRSGR